MGFVRSRTDKLMLVQGGVAQDGGAVVAAPAGPRNSRRDSAEGRPGDGRQAEMGQLNWSVASVKTAAPNKGRQTRRSADEGSYVGEACGECANFTLVRNGTCLKCDTCGATTGVASSGRPE